MDDSERYLVQYMTMERTASRQEERQRLLELRRTFPMVERTRLTNALLINLDKVFADTLCKVLGIYWPIKREIDLRKWATEASKRHGFQLALPVVTQKNQPLEYCRWTIGDSMTPGFWNIPVPKTPKPVDPDIVIAPLVGFCGCYRLGYGGGYFDRTLAHRRPRPAAIGIGFEVCRATNFKPQPHDIPMDKIVTERNIIYKSKME